MTRPSRSGEKPEQISMRMPKELVNNIDILTEGEGVDRSAVINKAVRYWSEVGGHIPTDHQIIGRLDAIEATPPDFAERLTSSYRTFANKRNSCRNSSANSRTPSTPCLPCSQKNSVTLSLFFLYCTYKYSTLVVVVVSKKIGRI